MKLIGVNEESNLREDVAQSMTNSHEDHRWNIDECKLLTVQRFDQRETDRLGFSIIRFRKFEDSTTSPDSLNSLE